MWPNKIKHSNDEHMNASTVKQCTASIFANCFSCTEKKKIYFMFLLLPNLASNQEDDQQPDGCWSKHTNLTAVKAIRVTASTKHASLKQRATSLKFQTSALSKQHPVVPE